MSPTDLRETEVWTKEERARLLKHIAVLPDPRRVAESLSLASLEALIAAERDRSGGYRLPQRMRDTRAWKQLVAAGIVESGWGGIGNFGMLVRRETVKMRLDGELE